MLEEMMVILVLAVQKLRSSMTDVPFLQRFLPLVVGSVILPRCFQLTQLRHPATASLAYNQQMKMKHWFCLDSLTRKCGRVLRASDSSAKED